RLTAILAADVAGYSRLVEADEEGTLAQWRAVWGAGGEPGGGGGHGRGVGGGGGGGRGGVAGGVGPPRWRADLHRGLLARNAELPARKRIEFRVGVNFGELIVDGGDFWGDGVNIAARLEALAEPGGICVSGRVQEDAQGKLDVSFEDTGEQQLKNIARPVRVYRVRFDGAAKSPPALPLPSKPSIAVLPFQNMTGDPDQEFFSDGLAEVIITF